MHKTKYEDLKIITEERLKTVKILIDAQDWMVAAYMMGCVLEYALKATSCKTLNLPSYPPDQSKKIETFFRNHEFDALLIISGMMGIFGSAGQLWNNWSAFTQYYLGDWNNMRYQPAESKAEPKSEWDEIKTKSVYNELEILISEIRKKW